MSEEQESKQPVTFSGIFELLKNLPLGAYSIVFALGGLSVLGLKAFQQGWQQPAPIYFQPVQATRTPLPTATPEPLNVYINGEVNQPGVYELPHDAILQDALFLAGGFSADAFEDVVNLAQPLTNGMQIHIPANQEAEAIVPLISTPPLATKSQSPNSRTDASFQDGTTVNLNTATKIELESLPGVGPSTAQKIIDYRENNGPFSSIEDVMNVSGIGPAKFESMSNFVIVDE